MKKPKKYLALYEEWMESNDSGYLCHTFTSEHSKALYPNDKLFPLLEPTEEDLWEYSLGKAWGVDDSDIQETEGYYKYITGTRFNPFRQNIVLLMAAMNGEL